MPTSCFVKNCKNVSSSKRLRIPGLSFHCFLAEGHPLREAWVVFCQRGRLPSKWDLICGAHFSESDFLHKNVDKMPNGRNILKSTAVPTRLGPDELRLREVEYLSPTERWCNQLDHAYGNDDIRSIQDIVQCAPLLQPKYCVASFSKGTAMTAVIFPSGSGSSPTEWFGRCVYFAGDLTPQHHHHGSQGRLPLPPSPITRLSALIQELDAFFSWVTCAGFRPCDDADANAKHGQPHPTPEGVLWRSFECATTFAPKQNQIRCEDCQRVTRLFGKCHQRTRRRSPSNSAPHKKTRHDYLTKEELIEALKRTKAEVKRMKMKYASHSTAVGAADTDLPNFLPALDEDSI